MISTHNHALPLSFQPRLGSYDEFLQDLTSRSSTHPYELLLNEGGASSFVIRQWMKPSEANDLFAVLEREVKWEVRDISLWGNKYPTPRCTAAFGDPDTTSYNYSQVSFPIHPWRPDVKAVRDRIWYESHLYFDSCLLNYYRSGKDCVGYHSDREALGERNAVVTVSLGGTRRFYFQPKESKESQDPQQPHKPRISIKTALHSGDCTVMLDKCQELFKHTVPRQKEAQPRISLTFRGINRDHYK